MKIVLSLTFVILILMSTAYHSYHVWKNKDYKTLMVQLGIISLAIISGILLIFDLYAPSISSILNKLSPL